MPKLSIIVPVYKNEKYLNKCVNSILNQTFTDFELILVDDGSPDNCGMICDDYALKDKRVKVIHQTNSGVSVARNRGIEVATGDYIGFVDSDDYISNMMYENLMNIAVVTEADIVKCGFQEFDDFQLGTIKRFYNTVECIENKSEILQRYFQGVLYIVIWNGIYKKEVVCNVQYPIGIIAEDNYASGMYLAKAKKVIFVDDVLYYYRQNFYGLSKFEEVNDRPLDVVVCWAMLHEKLKCMALAEEWFLIRLRKEIAGFVYRLIKNGKFMITLDKNFFLYINSNLEFRRKLKMYYYLISKKVLLK